MILIIIIWLLCPSENQQVLNIAYEPAIKYLENYSFCVWISNERSLVSGRLWHLEQMSLVHSFYVTYEQSPIDCY